MKRWKTSFMRASGRRTAARVGETNSSRLIRMFWRVVDVHDPELNRSSITVGEVRPLPI